MTDSLRDQLLTLGFKAPAPERKPPPKPAQGEAARKGAAHKGPAPRGHARDAGRAGKGGAGAAAAQRRPASGARGAAEMDLGKAYALRAQREKQERVEAEQRKQEEARQRREARARLETLLQGKALNDAAAEIARHFEYGGKIKRIYVNEAQLMALNAGELGVVQLNGRYLLVEAAVLAEAEAAFAPAVALKIDPDAPAQDDPYADPRYQVPDDLVW